MSLEKLRKFSVPHKIIEAIERFVKAIRDRYDDAEIYLFGSYAKGTWVDDSDVDIIVISKHFSTMQLEERIRALRILANSKIPFQILAYTPEEFKKVLRKSIVLQDAREYWIKL
ncbi:MAG: DNA polymerase III subunit beta [Thermoprotei archaeon]|nr:MAG: DNA polymerase III subunit beta [Thermoprotei archaeon]